MEKEILTQLKSARGQHTSMVTFLISSGYSLWLSNQKIVNELGTATNIKDKNNRKKVISSLKSIRERLSTYTSSPSTGLAIFSGCYIWRKW